MSNSPPLAEMPGHFIAVVGPSGVGKDSLMEALAAAHPDLYLVRRVITRAPNAGGEAFDAVTDIEFVKRVADDRFALHWTAHGLSYGIPSDVHDVLQAGQDALANLSRGMLEHAKRTFKSLVVLNIEATPDVLAQRLAGRGRENAAEITQRLARPAPVMPKGLTVIRIDNSGALQASVQTALAALYPVRA